MRNIRMIAINGLKKMKSNSIVIVLLVAIATLLVYVTISSFTSVNDCLDKKFTEANSSEILINCSRGNEETARSVASKMDGFVDLEEEECITCDSAKIVSNDVSESMTVVIQNFEFERTYSLPYLLDFAKDMPSDYVVLPYYLFIDKGMQIGDEFKIATATKEYTYHIGGFYEDVFYSNPTNIGIYKIFVNPSSYEELNSNALDYSNQALYPRAVLYIDIASGINAESFGYNLAKELPFVSFYRLDVDGMSSGATYIINILMAIMLLFAVVIIIVCVIVVRFTIISYIENNLKNQGTLSALGYTSKQLRLSTVIQFLIIGLAGVVLGLLLTQIFNIYIDKLFELSWGLKWNVGFSVPSAIITFLIVILFIIAGSYFSSNRFKLITPIVALRNGIETHNYKHNILPLKNTHLPKNIALGIKNLASNLKQSIAILVIISILTFASLTMTLIYSNFSLDSEDTILDIIGYEKPDVVCELLNDEIRDKIDVVRSELEANSNVDFTNAHNTISLIYSVNNKEYRLNTHVYDDTSILSSDNLVKGREPIYANEVVLTNVACNNLGLELGDVVYITFDDVTRDFLVVGISQQLSDLGQGARMSLLGAQNLLSENYNLSRIYIYLNEGISASDFITEISKTLNRDVDYLDYDSNFKASISSTISTVGSISIVLVAISIIIVVMISILIIKMRVMREKKNIGINKALGYSSKDLMIQMLVSFVPLIIIGAMLGAILSVSFTSPLFVLLLSRSGIVTANLDISSLVVVIGVLLVTMIAFFISTICSLKIAKIEPYKTITEI